VFIHLFCSCGELLAAQGASGRGSLALVVMLAIALGRIREKQKEKMHSLVRAA
jgi:hypothetical protein